MSSEKVFRRKKPCFHFSLPYCDFTGTISSSYFGHYLKFRTLMGFRRVDLQCNEIMPSLSCAILTFHTSNEVLIVQQHPFIYVNSAVLFRPSNTHIHAYTYMVIMSLSTIVVAIRLLQKTKMTSSKSKTTQLNCVTSD